MRGSALIFFIALGWSHLLFAESSLNFENYWQQIKDNNPLLKERSALIQSIEMNPALEIPAPEFAISQMNEKLPFGSSPKMQRTFELSQTVPFPTKFSNATELKKASSSKSREELKLMVKELKAEAFQLFLNYYKAQEEMKILNEKFVFYKDHFSRSKALPVTNQQYQVHLIDIEAELNTIKSEIKLKEIESNEIKVKFNKLRLANSTESIPEMNLPSLSSPATSNQALLKSHPILTAGLADLESMSREKEMAKLDWAPDFNFKLRSIKSYDPHYTDGKELMVGVTLPFLFPWQRSDKVSSINYKIKAQEYKNEQLKNQLEQEFSSLELKMKDQWELLSLYKTQSLPLVEKKLNRAHKLTALDMESLDSHRNAIDQLINLKMKILEEETNYRLTHFQLTELTTEEGTSK